MYLRCRKTTPKGHDMFLTYLHQLRAKGKYYFTFDQICTDLNLSLNSAKSGLYRLKRQGHIITPAKGLYVIVPPEYQSFGCIPEEDLVPILMQYLQADYYVGLLSAGLYHGATHQKPGSFQVVSSKRFKHPLQFKQIKIDILYKKSLAHLPTQTKVAKTGYLTIASPELVILDLFLYPTKSGGLNHTATVLYEIAPILEIEKLLRLAEIVGEKAWLQRLGYLLETVGSPEPKHTHLLIEQLAQYLEGKLKGFIALAPELATKGCPRLKKWMLIINTEIESDL